MTAEGISGFEEAFTLQQFGFDSSSSTSQDALLNSLMPIWTDISGSDVTDIMPYSMASAPVLATSQAAVSDMGPSGLAQDHDQQQQQQQQNNLFRNVPDNPFWGLPSSIDWAEWDEWYQQNQNWGPLRSNPHP